MRRALVLLLLATSALGADPRGRFSRFCSRTDQGRTSRGLLCDSLAFFEAFNGRGTTTACSTTAPTGAKGEALTFTRASTATCTRTASGGLATSGIANGDLTVLSANVARVSFDGAGTLGLLVESSRTNVNLQSADLGNAVYANVGAPTTTSNTTVSPDGTTTMATIQDNSAAAFEGRSQTVTVTSGQPYTLSVYVKAGTLSAVTVSLDGTTGTCTGLSGATSTRCIVTDASASGVAIVAQVTGGTVVGDTGTFIAWGQLVELGLYATSYIPTTSAAVTRAAETATFPGATLPANPYSLAVSLYPPSATTQGDLFYGNTATTGVGFFFVGGLLRAQNCNGTCANLSPAYAPPALTTTRLATSSTGGNQQTFVNGSSIAGPTATASAIAPWATATGIGPGVGPGDGIISRICVDPSPTRCR